MNRIIKCIIVSICTMNLYGQISLEYCQKKARENYPLIKQFELIEASTNFSVSNASKAYLPQVTLSAQATYQNEVASFPEEMAAAYQQMGINMKGLNKDQYKMALEINQTIWDGGITKAQKDIARADGALSNQNLEVEIYTIHERVNQLYFGILMLQEQQKQNTTLKQLLENNLQTIEAYIQNGTALASDANLIKVELLTAAQQRTQIETTADAYRKMLSLMIGEPIDNNCFFEYPYIKHFDKSLNERPELKLFDVQYAQFEAQKKALNASVMPRLGIFAQGFYGNPGFNLFKDMTENKWTLNYLGGIRMQWNLGSFYTLKGNKQKLSIAQKRIENQRETFLFNQEQKVLQQQKAVEKMNQIMADDQEIINLRADIRKTSEAKYANGTIAIHDLVRDIMAENQSNITKSIHEIELLKNIYDLKHTLNH